MVPLPHHLVSLLSAASNGQHSAETLALRFFNFTGLASCPVVHIEPSSVYRKSTVDSFVFVKERSARNGRQSRQITKGIEL